MPNNEKNAEPAVRDAQSTAARRRRRRHTPHGAIWKMATSSHMMPRPRTPPRGPHSPKMHPAPARPGRQPRTTAAMRQSPLPSNRPSALHAPIMPIRPALWLRS